MIKITVTLTEAEAEAIVAQAMSSLEDEDSAPKQVKLSEIAQRKILLALKEARERKSDD